MTVSVQTVLCTGVLMLRTSHQNLPYLTLCNMTLPLVDVETSEGCLI